MVTKGGRLGRLVRSFSTGVVACLAVFSTTAFAASVRIAETPNTGADDGFVDLAGSVTNDILLEGLGASILSQQMRLVLDSGYVVDHPYGSDTAPSTNLISGFGNAAFDSFLAAGTAAMSGVQPTVVAQSDMLGGPGGRELQLGAQEWDVLWGPELGQNTADQSDYLSARLTLSGNANGSLQYLASFGDNSRVHLVDIPVVNGRIASLHEIAVPIPPDPVPPPVPSVPGPPYGESPWSYPIPRPQPPPPPEPIPTDSFVRIAQLANGGLNDGQLDLAGSVTNDILLTSPGTKILSQQMRVLLDSGSILDHPFGSNAPPSAAMTGSFGNSEYDSFVAAGSPVLTESSPTILARSDMFGGPGGLGAEFGGESWDVLWGPELGQDTLDQIDYLSARLTLSGDANGILQYLASFGDSSSVQLVDIPIVNGQIQPLTQHAQYIPTTPAPEPPPSTPVTPPVEPAPVESPVPPPEEWSQPTLEPTIEPPNSEPTSDLPTQSTEPDDPIPGIEPPANDLLPGESTDEPPIDDVPEKVRPPFITGIDLSHTINLPWISMLNDPTVGGGQVIWLIDELNESRIDFVRFYSALDAGIFLGSDPTVLLSSTIQLPGRAIARESVVANGDFNGVPEPSTTALTALSVMGMVAGRRRRGR